MVQVIEQQGNIFGRIGKNVGQALSDQVPKEVERYRLSQGLKQFEQESPGLSPIQQLSRLSSIPGITPQMIESFGQLARQQSQGNAYKNASGNIQSMRDNERNPSEMRATNLNDIRFANLDQQSSRNTQNMPSVGEVNNQQRTPNIRNEEDIPQVTKGNVLNERNLPKLPWTPEERNAVVSDYINKGFLPDQAKQLQVDDEARDLAEPAVHKQRQADIELAKEKVRENLKRHLETKLQKTDKDVFKDVEGKMILNAERGMIRDLIKNPKADIDNVANDWSERLYNTAIAKGKMKTFGQTTGWENFLKGDTSQKKLKEYQEIFKRSGNLEEFKNILQGPDFGMSAQAAASEAYPPNPKISKFLSNYKSSPSLMLSTPADRSQKARKAALEVENDIGPDDSVLSIVRKLSDKDPYFDQQSFLDQISEDKDQLGLNERQRLELAEGVRNILPNWADILYLPIFRR